MHTQTAPHSVPEWVHGKRGYRGLGVRSGYSRPWESVSGEDLIWCPVHTYLVLDHHALKKQLAERGESKVRHILSDIHPQGGEGHAAMTPTPRLFAVFLSDASAARKTALVTPCLAGNHPEACYLAIHSCPLNRPIPPAWNGRPPADLIGPSSVCYKAFPTIKQTTH